MPLHHPAGQVQLKLNPPWRDGTTHLVMSPLKFMQRLAVRRALPRPAVLVAALAAEGQLSSTETRDLQDSYGSLWKALHSDPYA